MMATASLNVLAVYVAILTVLFLCTTDIVTDSDGVSHTVTIRGCFAPHQALLRLADRDFTEYLMKNTGEKEIARDVTEKLIYICLDYDTELKSTAEHDKEKTSELLDGNIITVGAERVRYAKVLSQPKTCERPDENIIIVHAKRFRCAGVLLQPR